LNPSTKDKTIGILGSEVFRKDFAEHDQVGLHTKYTDTIVSIATACCNMPVTDARALANLLCDETRQEQDLRGIEKYVKDDLFYRVIFVFNEDEAYKDGKHLYNDFMERCESIVGNVNGNSDDKKRYMKHLWKKMRTEKKYKEWLSLKRSNAYQAVQDKFYSKCSYC